MKEIKLMVLAFCILLISPVFVSAITFQHGSSRDVVQGYDKGWIWFHAYLKNDHTTAYCFDNPDFIDILKESQETQREVIITYETYLFRGFFCMTSDKFDNVIITNVKFVDNNSTA
jgi:phenolic acid decarboxylase